MKLQDEIDFTTLNWVKQELDETLKQARQALEVFVEDPVDTSQMRFCATYLHQVQGTLRMVELYGASMVVEEMERLALSILEGDVKPTEEIYQVLMRGIVQLPDYLERLQSGHKDIPVVLLPLLNDLRASRGEKLLSENVLFSPDLSVELPDSVKGPEKIIPDEKLQPVVARMRLAFQFGLLKWFKEEDPELIFTRLTTILDRLQALSSQVDARRLWWVAGGVLEALLLKGLDTNVTIKLLFGRVDREIRRLSNEGETSFAEDSPQELTKSLLYYVAHASCKSRRVEELKRLYRLDELLPDASELEHAQGSLSGHNRELLDTVSEGIRDDLLSVKDKLDLHLRDGANNPKALGELSETLDRVADTLGMLGLGVPRKMVQEQSGIITEIAEEKRACDEDALMDIAGALLYVESSLDNYIERLGGEDDEEQSSAAGSLPASEVRRILKALMHEASQNLQQTKQDIVAFIEAPWDHERIQETPRLLEEIVGALRMLDMEEPASLLDKVVIFAQQELLKNREVPTAETLDILADAVSSIEYYLEAVRDQRSGRERILGITREAVEKLEALSGNSLAPDDDGEELDFAFDEFEDDVVDLPDAELDDDDQPSLQQEDEHQAEGEDDFPSELSLEGSGDAQTTEADHSSDDVEDADHLAAELDDLQFDFGLEEDHGAEEQPDASAEPSSELREDDAAEEFTDVSTDSDAAEPSEQSSEPQAEAIAESDTAATEEQQTSSSDADNKPASSDSSGFGDAAIDDIDDEIREIFVEEVEDELTALQEAYPKWRSDLDNEDELTNIRRTFHTLKGSGRLVGALTIGEFAWQVENMLNRVLDNSIEPNDAVLGVMDVSVNKAIPELLEGLKSQAPLTVDIEEIKSVAEKLSKGEDARLQTEHPVEESDTDSVDESVELTDVDSDQEEEQSVEQDDIAVAAETVDQPSEEDAVEEPSLFDEDQDFSADAVEDEHSLLTPADEDDIAVADVDVDEAVDQSEDDSSDDIDSWFSDDDAVSSEADVQDDDSPLEPAADVQEVDQPESEKATSGLDWSDIDIPMAGEDEQSKETTAQDAGESAEQLTEPLDDTDKIPSLEEDQGDEPEGEENIAFADDQAHVDEGGDGGQDEADLLFDWDDAPREEDNDQPAEDDLEDFSADLASSTIDLTEVAENEATEEPVEELVELVSQDASDSEQEDETLSGTENDADLEDSSDADEAAVKVEIDPVLLDILRGEVETHINAVRSMLQGPALSEPVNDEMVRSVHTLNGAFSMADIKPAYQVTGPFEGLVKRLRANEKTLDVRSQQLCERACTFIESLTRAIGSEDGVPTATELAEELSTARDALPEGLSNAELLGLAEDEHQLAADHDREDALQEPDRTDQTDDIDLEISEISADDVALSDLDDSERLSVDDEIDSLFATPDNDSESSSERSKPDEGEYALATPQLQESSEEVTAASEDEPTIQIESEQRSDQLFYLDEADIDEDLLDIFLQEGEEILDEADRLMAEFRDAPQETEYVVGMQRELHTLKGGARMAGLTPIGDLSHAMETVFEAISEEKVAVNKTAIEVMETAFDRLHAMIEATQKREGIKASWPVVMQLDALMKGRAPESPAKQVDEAESELRVPDEKTPVPLAEPTKLDVQQGGASTAPRKQQGEMIRVRSDLLDNLVNFAGEVSIYRSRLEQQVSSFRFNLIEFEQTVERLRDQLRNLEMETEAQILSRHQREAEESDAEFDPLELDRYSQLQQLSRALAESVSDLVSLQGMMDDLTRTSETLLLQQSRVNSELQEGLMRTRMIPFESLVPRLRRILRQTASELGKKATLRVEGAHGEMDRTVLERVTAPLEHMLRNALAHGLESPEQREAADKPEEGEVKIQVDREATEVVLKISDDGGGINADVVRQKAIERGLLSEDVHLPDRDLYRFILESGFSTATEVTKVSGRGVGMDVVANELKQLGGSLDIESWPGEGTQFTVRLPFTLAVTHAIMVRIMDHTFAIPLSSIEGVVRMPRKEFEKRKESGDMAYQYAGDAFQIYELGGLLHMSTDMLLEDDRVPLLITRLGAQRAAIRVDHVLGNREIVVKSVGPQVSSIPGIFGATILGDGSVVVILDLSPLVRRTAAQQITDEQGHVKPIDPAQPEVDETEEDKVYTIMVVDDSITMRKVASRVLERQGFEVTTAKDGVDAVQQLQERIPDLMLLDIEMPRMDGYELATHVRNDVRLRDIPIIMITSRTGEKHRERALELGVNRYLGKPYQEPELLRNVNELLGREVDGTEG